MKCDWVKDNLALYVYDELADDARYEFEQHIGRCPECERELTVMQEFRTAMSVPVAEPDANLLTSARLRLNEALETTEQGNWLHRITFDLGHSLQRIKLQPALVAAIFLFGFAVGGGSVYKVARGQANNLLNATNAATAAETANASVAGIRSVTPDPGTNKVTIKYDTVRSEELQGSLNDSRIQQLLLYAAHSNYNPGVRQDSIGLLVQSSSDQTVRQSLMYSLHYDTNPGVQLTALDGLGSLVKEDQRVRDAVLDALLSDSNAGVRNRAMELLQPVRADSTVRAAFEHLAQKDKSDSIRAQAKAVLAQIPEID